MGKRMAANSREESQVNRKASKFIRAVSTITGTPEKLLKRKWNDLSHTDRAFTRKHMSRFMSGDRQFSKKRGEQYAIFLNP